METYLRKVKKLWRQKWRIPTSSLGLTSASMGLPSVFILFSGFLITLSFLDGLTSSSFGSTTISPLDGSTSSSLSLVSLSLVSFSDSFLWVLTEVSWISSAWNLPEVSWISSSFGIFSVPELCRNFSGRDEAEVLFHQPGHRSYRSSLEQLGDEGRLEDHPRLDLHDIGGNAVLAVTLANYCRLWLWSIFQMYSSSDVCTIFHQRGAGNFEMTSSFPVQIFNQLWSWQFWNESKLCCQADFSSIFDNIFFSTAWSWQILEYQEFLMTLMFYIFLFNSLELANSWM